MNLSNQCMHQLHALGEYWILKITLIRTSCAILVISSHTHEISNILHLKIAKNDSWCLSTAASIPSGQQCFHLDYIGGDLAPDSRYWASSLCLHGCHHQKQNHQNVANLQLQTPSSPKQCSFTQYQHARYSFHIMFIDSTCWFGRFIRYCPSWTKEQKKVQSDADTGHRALGIVYSMHYKETPPLPAHIR